MESNQLKCCKITVTCFLRTCKHVTFFVKMFSILHLNNFVSNVFNKENLPKIHDKKFNKVIYKTLSKKLKQKFRAKYIDKQNKIKKHTTKNVYEIYEINVKMR